MNRHQFLAAELIELGQPLPSKQYAIIREAAVLLNRDSLGINYMLGRINGLKHELAESHETIDRLKQELTKALAAAIKP